MLFLVPRRAQSSRMAAVAMVVVDVGVTKDGNHRGRQAIRREKRRARGGCPRDPGPAPALDSVCAVLQPEPVKSQIAIVLVLAVAVTLTACKQADGPMPEGSAEVENRIHDLSRDLLAVAAGEEGAPKDFADDLRVFAKGKPGEDASDAFSAKVGEAATGLKLTDESALRLAHAFWMVVAAQELSERQIDALKTDLATRLSAVAVPAARVETLTAQAVEVQKVVNVRPRRWYERY